MTFYKMGGIQFLLSPQKKLPEGWRTFRCKVTIIHGGTIQRPNITTEIMEYHCASVADALALLKIWNGYGNGIRTYERPDNR